MTEIQYRLRLRQRVMSLVVAGIFWATGLVQLIDDGGRFPTAFPAGLLFVSIFFVLGRFGADLDPSGITVRGIRARRITWHDIADIQFGGLLRPEYVRLRLRTGRTLRLRAPITAVGRPDPEFGEKAATIRQWWLHYTGQLAA
ncbi:MAG: hypothetical protein QOD41_1671 [Cryptosporangiaceae bacterium]|nr:hypothetical protein [Cryptosporangiaceae bacterium]